MKQYLILQQLQGSRRQGRAQSTASNAERVAVAASLPNVYRLVEPTLLPCLALYTGPARRRFWSNGQLKNGRCGWSESTRGVIDWQQLESVPKLFHWRASLRLSQDNRPNFNLRVSYASMTTLMLGSLQDGQSQEWPLEARLQQPVGWFGGLKATRCSLANSHLRNHGVEHGSFQTLLQAISAT